MTAVAGSYPLFHEPWWLEAVAPDRWGESVVRRGDEVVARLPYVRKKRLGLTILTMPPLTHTLGPWLSPLEGRNARRLNVEKELMNELIVQLPPFDLFQETFSPHVTNTLPFYWGGFESVVRYTKRLDELSDLEALWEGFDGRLRASIRKAQKQVEVRSVFEVSTLLELSAKTFARQGLPLSFPADALRRINDACLERNAIKIFTAVDDRERVRAALAMVWDDTTAYNLMNGRDHDIEEGGSQRLLIWEAIRFASTVTKAFDFTGSMIEPIERTYRNFRARQVSYFLVRKASRRMRSLLSVRELVRALRGEER